MSDFHVIYHYWNNKFRSPIDDENNPVILSIITWRLYNKDVKISVLDCSLESNYWGDFPDLLNFQVINYKPFLHKGNRKNLLANRIWDIQDYADSVDEKYILFNDADVFWLKNPFPLFGQIQDGLKSGIHCNGNTGIFYFDKTSKTTQSAFGFWKQKTFDALNKEKKICRWINQKSAASFVYDEIILLYIFEVCGGYLNGLWHNIPDIENFCIGDLNARTVNWNKVKKNKSLKNVHLMGFEKKTEPFKILNSSRKIKTLIGQSNWERIFLTRKEYL